MPLAIISIYIYYTVFFYFFSLDFQLLVISFFMFLLFSLGKGFHNKFLNVQHLNVDFFFAFSIQISKGSEKKKHTTHKTITNGIYTHEFTHTHYFENENYESMFVVCLLTCIFALFLVGLFLFTLRFFL